MTMATSPQFTSVLFTRKLDLTGIGTLCPSLQESGVMRTSGIASEGKLTVAVFLIAIGFLMVLAGGPSQFMLAVERTLEAAATGVYEIYQNMRA
jgi:hypothetical protein